MCFAVSPSVAWPSAVSRKYSSWQSPPPPFTLEPRNATYVKLSPKCTSSNWKDNTGLTVMGWVLLQRWRLLHLLLMHVETEQLLHVYLHHTLKPQWRLLKKWTSKTDCVPWVNVISFKVRAAYIYLLFAVNLSFVFIINSLAMFPHCCFWGLFFPLGCLLSVTVDVTQSVDLWAKYCMHWFLLIRTLLSLLHFSNSALF